MDSKSYLNRMLGIGPETAPVKASAPWDTTVHMRHVRVCDAFLKVAEGTYIDLLPRVREDLARAMSFWMTQDGYRADVEWSFLDGCFVGRIRHLLDDVEFRGATPSDVQEAFKAAVKAYLRSAVFLLPAPSSVPQLEHRA